MMVEIVDESPPDPQWFSRRLGISIRREHEHEAFWDRQWAQAEERRAEQQRTGQSRPEDQNGDNE